MYNIIHESLLKTNDNSENRTITSIKILINVLYIYTTMLMRMRKI